MQDLIIPAADLETARWLTIYVMGLLGVSSLGTAAILWLRSNLPEEVDQDQPRFSARS